MENITAIIRILKSCLSGVIESRENLICAIYASTPAKATLLRLRVRVLLLCDKHFSYDEHIAHLFWRKQYSLRLRASALKKRSAGKIVTSLNPP